MAIAARVRSISASTHARPIVVMVIGSRAYGPIHHVLLGSVSARLMRTARCPLLVVPRAGHTINSEEPAAVNAALAELFAAVEAGRWLAHKPA